MADHSEPIERAAFYKGNMRQKRGAISRTSLGVITLLAGAGGYWAVTHHQPASVANSTSPPRPAVTVSPPLQRNLAQTMNFTGQFSAVDHVDLRAQVSGYLTEIHFTDGQIVHKGDLLYVIDPRPYLIQLQQATAQFQTAAASLDLANKQVSRSTVLHRNDFASGETLDQRTQVQQAALAAIEQAKAAIRSAQLNLDFTRITAPFTGRIGARLVSIGGLVSGGIGATSSTNLGSLVSLDPIHLDFDMSESDAIAYQRYLATKQPELNRSVRFSLSDEATWRHTGTMDFLDNQVDRGSGTMRARATVANLDFLIAPGQFARLELPVSAPRPVLLVPDSALVTDQSGKMVMIALPDGTVVPKQVETGALDGDHLRVVTKGLTPDDQIIINGLMRLRPGTKVAPHLGTIHVASE